MTDIVLITGLSGAGRTNAADDLEDLGWFVVDNLPITLLDKVVELSAASDGYQRIGIVVGPTEDQDLLLTELARLRNGDHYVRVLFLEASTSVLVNRYTSSRRKHPLDDGASGIADSIERERALLQPVKEASDVVIDTTSLTVHQLKARIHDVVEAEPDAAMRIAITSFGFKHGVPTDVDLVMDVRFLPNPHWVEELRPLTGLDLPVRRYVLEQPATGEFLARFEHLLDLLVPAYTEEGKSYLSIAVGCTGGRHRSVVIVEELVAWFRRNGYSARAAHRDATLPA